MRTWIAVLIASSAATAAHAYAPETNYTLHCQGCHLEDGAASADRVPALAGSVARFLRVPEGRAFLVRVPGSANAPLADADLAVLLEWMLRRFDAANVPADFVPYTAEEVHRLRAEPLVDVAPVRRRLLDAIAREP